MSQLSDFELPKCWGRKNHKGVLAQFAGKFRDGRFGTDEVTTIRLLFRCAEDGCRSGRCEKIDFAEISSEPKCMPQAQRSLIRDPGAIFLKAEIAPRF